MLRLGSTLILARILSPEDFGLIAMVTALTGLVEVFKDVGLGIATVQRKDITHREISSLFWINVGVGCLFALTFVALSPAISWFYEDDRLVAITLPLATTLLWGGMVVQHEALLSRQLKQGHLAFIRMTATLLSSIGGILLAFYGFGYWALVIREVARSLIYLLGVWWICGWMPSMVLRPREVSGFLNFGRDLTFTHVVMAIIGKIDGVLVGKFFGPVSLGAYRQAQNLIMAPLEQFNTPIFSVAQPALSRLQSEPDRYRRYYQRVVGFVAMVTMPLGVFVAAYPTEITLVILGEKWIQAAPFLGVFAVAVAVRPTIATTAIVLVTLGRAKVLLALALAHSLLLTLLMLTGISFGALGIALAHVATSVLFILPNLHYSFKDSPINVGAFFVAIRMPLISSVCMGVVLGMLRLMAPIASPVLSLLTGAAIAGIIYLLPWILTGSGRAELRLIVEDIRYSLVRKADPSSQVTPA